MNDIHRWGENDQHPMVRMFLTRTVGLVCAFTEIGASIKQSFHLSILTAKASAVFAAKVGRLAFPNNPWLTTHSLKPIPKEDIKGSLEDLYKLVAGIASTIFIGVLFSPEINFRNHLFLGLAADDLAVKRERDLAAKLAAENTIAELARARAERYNIFVEARDAQRKEETEKNRVDSRLADLLCPLNA